MSDTIIEAAVTRGYISQAQADLLNEELFMFPGGNVIAIMLRRSMISAEQAKILESGETPVDTDLDTDESDFDFGPLPSLPPLSSFSKEEVSVPPSRIHPNPDSSASLRTVPGEASRPSLSEALKHSFAAAKSATPQSPASVQVKAKPFSDSLTIGKSAGINPDANLLRLFVAGRERGCSDLHLTVGKPPYLRKDGKIFFLDEPTITAEAAIRLNRSVLTPPQQQQLEADLQLDFSFECGAGRFRANVYNQRLGIEAAYRFIPSTVPTIADLGLPRVLEKLTTYPQGMNLVTGPGGSGKTSTVVAMLEFINRHRHEHIITVEDPVEYVIHSDSCQVTQREVGTHTESFAHALRTALRQDPDVIMIGELRDLETTSISITAAETGHLVFGTLHTSSAIRTVARILDVYPPAQRAQICMMVAESLRGIMSQQLIERKDGKGRVCAMEVLLVTTGVAQVIKEGKTHQLVSHMQSGRKLGMISMDDALMELFQSGTISGQTAYAHAENKSMFEMAKGQA